METRKGRRKSCESRSGETTGVKQKLAPFALDSFGRSPLWLRPAGARFSGVYVVTAGNLETWHCEADRRAVLARTLWSFSPPDTILLANEIVLPYNLVDASLHSPWSAHSVSPVPQPGSSRRLCSAGCGGASFLSVRLNYSYDLAARHETHLWRWVSVCCFND